MPALLADAMRLAKPGPSDEVLLALAGDAETAYEIAKVLWQRFRTTENKKLYTEASEASKKMGHIARDVFGHKARTIQGVLAKLRIVELAYGTGDGNTEPPDLEAYQRGSWLGSTIKDLDRLAEGTS